MTTSTISNAALLEAMINLTKFHREHEKFYASSPRKFAVTLQRHARALQAVASDLGLPVLLRSRARRSARPRTEPGST
jgi:hypothetical protein